MKKLFLTLRNRWQAKTPLIFSRIIKIAVGMSTSAITFHTICMTNNIDEPEWWLQAMPYIVGIGVGAGAVAKLTQQYDKDNNPIRKPRKPRKSKWEHTL